MTAFPIRDKWYLRPGWSEFTAWRDNATKRHGALDIYAPRGTKIFASGKGVVTRKGAPSPNHGHGHYVAIQYGEVELSYSHLIAASPLHEGQNVDVNTLVGGVGNTGNAFSNDWPASESPTGSTLQHVHIEARRGNGVSGELFDPLTYFDTSALAGSDGTPIANPTIQEDDMPRLVKRTEGTAEWSLFDPSFSGPSPLERGYYLITDPNEALDWARLLYKGSGTEQMEPRAVYVRMQAAARKAHAAWVRSQPKSTATAASELPKSVIDAITRIDAGVKSIVATLARVFK